MILPRRFLAPSAALLLVAASACGGGSSGGAGGSGANTGVGTGTGIAGKCGVFPSSSPWNTDVSGVKIDQAVSDTYMANMNPSKALHPDFGSVYGIPYQYVDGSVAKVPVSFDYASESDPGPYPIPPNPLVEDGSDAHILMIHNDECKLYELYAASQSGGMWHAGSGAIWDLATNSTRPTCWTSADAAGLPIFPGLARYEEAKTGAINHALRFTMSNVQAGFTAPAEHYAGNKTDPSLPPFGLRVRLKASTDLSKATPQAKIVLVALQKYGMFLADIGSDWYIGGAPDMSWSDDDLGFIKTLHGSDFEVVPPGPITTNCN